MRIDVIIPFHNVYAQRGISRLLYSVHSITQQTKKFNKIILICSSKLSEYKKVCHLLAPYNTQIIHSPAASLNLSRLFNIGIKASGADFIQILGCDFMLRKDYGQHLSRKIAEDKLIIKRVRMLPKLDIDLKRINYWQFPECEYNGAGDLANGIICASREWFISTPYDERFKLLGAMDNLQVLKAEKELTVEWMEESEILHIWHKQSKLKRHKQFMTNIGYVNEYKDQH